MYLHHLIDQKMHLHFFTRFLFWWKKVSQATFQRCFNVVGLIWRRNVGQSQIKVETTRCMSTLKLATLNIVESTLSISTLILANNLWLCQNNIVTFNVEFQYDIWKKKLKSNTYAKPQAYTTISKSCWLYE